MQTQAQCPETEVDTAEFKMSRLHLKSKAELKTLDMDPVALKLYGQLCKAPTKGKYFCSTSMKFYILPPLQHVPFILLWVEGEEALWPSLLPLAGVQCVHHLRVHLLIELIHTFRPLFSLFGNNHLIKESWDRFIRLGSPDVEARPTSPPCVLFLSLLNKQV